MQKSEEKYYVYRHIRLDKDIPFYIGIGTKVTTATCHTNLYHRAYVKYKRNNIWASIVNKTDYIVEILLESDNYTFIEDKEIEFIRLYGRIDLNTGSLANMTDGGKSLRNCRRPKSMECRKKMSEKKKGVKFTEEHKKNLSKAKLIQSKNRGIVRESIETNCIVCQKKYMSNKYQPSKTCSSTCGRTLVNNSKVIEQYSKDDVFIREFKNCREAAEYFNCTITNIRQCLLKRRKLAKGFKWKFKNYEI